ncbi:MAG: ATP-binding cassette domain-containing protein [Ignavibacteriae bacterium]|nr:MAG: ATP-binding cassette domain-containing protein [Ignavibacteriota bacterium]
MKKEIIKVTNLIAFFGDRLLNRPISFSAKKGESVMLYGKNGIGKSSLINVMIGQVTSYTGNVFLYSQKPQRNKFYILYNAGVRYVPQNPILPMSFPIEEYFKFFRNVSFIDKVKTFISKAGIKKESLIAELSYGQKRIVEIILALYSNPSCIIVDELSSGINEKNLDFFYSELNAFLKAGGIILTSGHNKNEYLINNTDVQLLQFIE